MYQVSDLFKQYAGQSDRTMDVKVNIQGTDYTGSSVIEFEIEDSAVLDEAFAIGTVIPSKLSLSILTSDDIVSNAVIKPYIMFKGSNGNTEWIPLGEYYIDSRKYLNKVYSFTCYDKLILAEQSFKSSLIYPKTMKNVLEEICTQLGLTLDDGTLIDGSYMIPYKSDEYTIRDMLSYIASAHGCSCRLKKDGKISFITFTGTSTDIEPNLYTTAVKSEVQQCITKISVTYNSDSEVLEKGSEGLALSFFNPFITQTMLDNIYAKFNGFTYLPYEMNWRSLPYLEIGDRINIKYVDTQSSSLVSYIFTNKLSYKGGLWAISTAPAKSTQKSEFNYEGSLTKQVATLNKTTIKEDMPYYGVSIGRENGIKVSKSDGSSEVTLNSDKIAFSVGGQDKLYFDPVIGKYVFDGDLSATTIEAIKANIDIVVSNTIITQNLYSGMGNIARLTVDKLLTVNILDGLDTMNYVDIQGEYIRFMKGIKNTSLPQVQYTDNNRVPLYWNDSMKTLMSTTITAYPVMVYQYDYSERMKIFFDTTTATYYPKMIWGEGVGDLLHPEYGRGFMYKDETGMSIEYITSTGANLSLKLGEDGAMINGSPYHKITFGTADPTGGVDGDIYFKVV